MVIILHFAHGSQQNITHKHVTQKLNCCISKTREFPAAGNLTCVFCLVSLLMLTRTQASRPRPGPSIRDQRPRPPWPRTTSLFLGNLQAPNRAAFYSVQVSGTSFLRVCHSHYSVELALQDKAQAPLLRFVVDLFVVLGPRLLWRTNRKSHMRFDWYQNQWPWMTLNGQNALL